MNSILKNFSRNWVWGVLVLSLFAQITAWPTVPAKEPDSVLIWDKLERSSLKGDSQTGLVARNISADAQKLFGKPIEVSGYILANEFDSGQLSQFLLTHYSGGCIHVPLPPPNSMIEVDMAPGRTAPPLFKKRVTVTGVLSQGDRVDSLYKMVATEVKEFPFTQ